jgi:hypothetical protein
MITACYVRKREVASILFGIFKGQKRARLHGNPGIPGIAGNVVCATYRI